MGKKCWYCGQDTQEPDPDPRWRGWYICTNCGASHNPNPTGMKSGRRGKTRHAKDVSHR